MYRKILSLEEVIESTRFQDLQIDIRDIELLEDEELDIY